MFEKTLIMSDYDMGYVCTIMANGEIIHKPNYDDFWKLYSPETRLSLYEKYNVNTIIECTVGKIEIHTLYKDMEGKK